MSRFTDTMYRNAHTSTNGMVTGEPHHPVRHTWGEVHEKARRAAGGLAAAGVGHGEAVGVLAGAPSRSPRPRRVSGCAAPLSRCCTSPLRAPTCCCGRRTPRTVIDMIDARVVIVSDPFMAAVPVLENAASGSLTVEQLLGRRPDRSGRDRRGRPGDDAINVRLDRVSQGGPDHPPQPGVQRRGDVRRRPSTTSTPM